MAIDLLSTVESGGCSAKLSPKQLSEILGSIPVVRNANILVDIQTHDDAGVYQLNEDTALIVTTDFFPPICSDAFEFGQIAAANALSDVYAMGGDPLLALNLMMFSSAHIPLEEFGRILQGGQDKITESNAFIMGGHTINDHPPKYGLAVVGIVHPSKLITNAGAGEGQKLILTKPLGTGILVAAQRMGLIGEEVYRLALDNMKRLNKAAKDVMQQYGAKGATDITGFGLVGHAMQMAAASNVSFRIDVKSLPLLPQVVSLIDNGCVPGATYRNLDYAKGRVHFSSTVPMAHQVVCADAQTSGGLFFGIDAHLASQAIDELHRLGDAQAAIVGDVLARGSKEVYFE
jgi:selenide, water dikinase